MFDGEAKTGGRIVAGGDGLISLKRTLTTLIIWFLSASPFMPICILFIMFSLEANFVSPMTSNIHFSKSLRG